MTALFDEIVSLGLVENTLTTFVDHSTGEARMGLLSWVVFGILAGAMTRFLVPGQAPTGILMTMVLGILGAIVGGFIGSLLGIGSISGFDIRSMFLAVLGGAIVLFIRGSAARQ